MDENDWNDLMNLQRTLAQRIMTESDTDMKIKVLNIINDLNTDKQGRFRKEALLIETRHNGIQDSETQRVIDSLKGDGMLAENNSGLMQRT